jgi:hypothetical protein
MSDAHSRHVEEAIESVRGWIEGLAELNEEQEQADNAPFDPALVLARVMAPFGKYAELMEHQHEGRTPQGTAWAIALREIAAEAIVGVAQIHRQEGTLSRVRN